MATHRQGRRFSLQPLVQISGERLREAIGDTSLREFAASLPATARVSRAQIGHLTKKRGGRRRVRANVLAAIADALGVSPEWLGGAAGPPIRFRFKFPIENAGGEAKGWGLKRARLLARCLKAARRDYELLEGRKAEGEEWSRIEFQLFKVFWVRLDPSADQQTLFVWPASTKPGSTVPFDPERFERDKRRVEVMMDRAAEYWERVLEPWFRGSVGLDYRALAKIPTGEVREEQVSPKVLLEA